MSKGSFIQEFLAGNAGGLVGITVVYPLDTAKMRLQTYSRYTGFRDVISSMIKTDGVSSLYRGIASPAIGFGFTFAISFSGYGWFCRSIADHKGKKVDDLNPSELFIAGAFTGFIQAPCRAIVERIKSVMQVREINGKAPYSWSGACAVDLVRKEGFRNGLFQGFNSVLLREVPQFAVYYPCYAVAKKLFIDNGMNTTMAQFLAGGTAGCVQWLPPIYCFDVIKSRMQTAPQGYYTGMWDCVRKLVKEEGYGVFCRGLTPALMRAFPLHAIIFLGYELTMSYTERFFSSDIDVPSGVAALS